MSKKKANNNNLVPTGYRVKCSSGDFEQFFNANQRDAAYVAANNHMRAKLDHKCRVYKIY